MTDQSAVEASPARTDEQYLAYDPFFGDESDIRNQTIRIGRIRKDQKCVPPSLVVHDIPAGTRARIERAIVDGKWATAYVCLECMDKWLDEFDDEEYCDDIDDDDNCCVHGVGFDEDCEDCDL